MEGAAPDVSVLISTVNRREDVRRAVASVLAQTARVEVLVMDDGSTDGTAELVRTEFPEVRLYRSERSQGSIVQRNRGVALARAPVVVTLDDDAALPSPSTLAQTLAEFDHPRIGVVAIPVLERRVGTIMNQAPRDGRFVGGPYNGAAAALRRELFLALGGYWPQMRYGGEELDYWIRLLDAGYVARLGSADPAEHYKSQARDLSRWHALGASSQVLWAWRDVPMPYLVPQLGAVTLNALILGLRIGRLRDKARGLLIGYATAGREFRKRRPVRRQTYRLSRLLRHRGPLSLEEIEPLLPPLRGAGDQRLGQEGP